MKGIITTVVVIGVIGAGAYLWRKAHTETREITEEEFNQMCEDWAKEVDKR